ncbi:MAG: pyridoxamine 5'-phosphate oxidase family protein [Acidimicrobiia bacterium]|nr:pyridoxamine 5'-phosphate oxidase family protein [Acidimicrobiia bacterium]
MAVDRHGLEMLSRDECLALLDTASVGRIGLSEDALPVIFPVNFVVDGDRVVIGTADGVKLTAASRQLVVAFQADSWDPLRHTGWSVLVRGTASAIEDPAEVAAAERLPLRPWGRPRPVRYISIALELVEGRRLDQPGGSVATNGSDHLNERSGRTPG